LDFLYGKSRLTIELYEDNIDGKEVKESIWRGFIMQNEIFNTESPECDNKKYSFLNTDDLID